MAQPRGGGGPSSVFCFSAVDGRHITIGALTNPKSLVVNTFRSAAECRGGGEGRSPEAPRGRGRASCCWAQTAAPSGPPLTPDGNPPGDGGEAMPTRRTE